MHALIRLGTTGTLVAALYGLGGCNAILGIEEAELDETQATACKTGQGATLGACDMGDATGCESAVGAACSDEQIAACLKNSECRKALANYRTCQTDDCRDPTGACTGCLTASSGASCFAKAAPRCQGSELVSLCDIFCACMDDKCHGQLPDCLSACRAQPSWRTNCHLTHCELAVGASDHCLHATDALPRCPDSPPAVDATCTGKNLAGYGCDFGSQCCSGSCSHQFCDAVQSN